MKKALQVIIILFLVNCMNLTRGDYAMRSLEQNASQLRANPNAGNLDKYVSAIIAAYTAEVDKKGKPLQQRKLADSKTAAIDLLNKQIEKLPAEAHYLLARKGALYLYAGQGTEAETALTKSYALRPNIGAARYLILYFANRNNQIAMSSMCQEAVMTTDNGNEQYDFINECRTASGAATEEGKMAWATSNIKAFYQEETVRRQKIENENRRRAAIARAEESKRQAKVQRHQQRVNGNKKVCEAKCGENAAYCKRSCGSVDCKNTCIEAQNACYQKCYEIAQRDL